ncbi:MAG: hypothetical protein JNK14_07495 [Chitinophagaceae bacterium]|nr:hypothetical protein [Chitinophagaceae bacterium]
MFNKVIVSLFITLFTHLEFVFCQGNILIEVKKQTLELNKGAILKVPLSVSNYSDSTVLIPESPNIFNRKGMDIAEIGVDLFLIDSLKEINCSPSYLYARDPVFIPLKRGETKVIKAFFPESCLTGKGMYRVSFYLKIPDSTTREMFKYYRSNETLITVR